MSTETAQTWDITIGWDDGVAVNVSVCRRDGLPFDEGDSAWFVADHVRKGLATEGTDAGRQSPAFIKGRTVCVVRD